jgi:hypothetical protein
MREMSRPIIVAEQRAARELLRRTLFPTISAAPQDQGAGLGCGIIVERQSRPSLGAAATRPALLG